jgi:hypothetical protein
VAGRPHQPAGTQHIAIELCASFRLIFCANHNTVPMLDASSVDWARVSRVQILRIERYDD